MSNLDAFPQFTRKYGEFQPKSGTYEVPAPWQAGLSNVSGRESRFAVICIYPLFCT